MASEILPHPWVSTWDAMGFLHPYRSKDQWEKHSSSPKSRRAPVHDLPTEILQGIFLLACPAVYAGKVNFLSPSTGPESPWKLELVCSRWCLVAQSYHALWSTINIEAMLGSSQQGIKPILKMQLGLCLERSGTQPLMIRVGDRMNAYPKAVREILEIVGRHSERWQSVAFHFPLSNIAVGQVEQVKERLPLLRSIEVQVGKKHATEVAEETCRGIFLQAPSLTKVSISNMLAFQQALDLPWQQIHELRLEHLESISPADLWGGLMDISSNLTKLTLSNISFPFYILIPIAYTTVEFSKLRELSVLNCANSCGLILGELVCPSLTSLTIHHNRVPLNGHIDAFLMRSECPIKYLMLHNVHSSDVLSFITKLDTITHLDLSLDALVTLDSVLEMLGRGSQGRAVPGLASLRLEFRDKVTTRSTMDYLMQALRKVLVVISPRHLDVGFIVKKADVEELWEPALLGGLRSFCISRKMTVNIYQIAAEEDQDRNPGMLSVSDLRTR